MKTRKRYPHLSVYKPSQPIYPNAPANRYFAETALHVSGSFVPPVRFAKQEIHPVFLCFPTLPGKQNLSLSMLAD